MDSKLRSLRTAVILLICSSLGLLSLSRADAQYAGNYSGTFAGGFSGVWSFTVDASGNLTGRAVDTGGEVSTGSGTVSVVGGFAMAMAAGSDITFTGQINAAGNVTGTWEDTFWLASGTVSGSRLPTTVAQFAGTYSGTLAGDFSGTWASTVDSAGNWTGSGTVPGFGTFGVNGIVSGAGAITTYIEEGGILTGQINSSGQAFGTWTDYTYSGTFTGSRTSAPAPEIAVEQPAATNITDGGSKDFGSVSIGASTSLTFTIKNTGSANLTGLTITKDGTHSANFTVGSLGATTLTAGASTTFAVTFTPSAVGSRTAAIHIASNDVDENPFDINLSGSGVDPSQTVAGAIDLPAVQITSGGQAPWTWQSITTHDATDAAQSGTISHNQSSSFEFSTTGPGTVSFWWKVSSESGYDYLRFYIDGEEQSGKISGVVDWTQKSYPLTSGNHILKWTYSKDGSDSSGSDCGWVDQVVLASGPEIAVEQPAATNISDGGSKNFGSVNIGSSASLTFTIKNAGSANLTSLAITKDGANAADFALGSLGATTVAASANTTFTVTFAPSAVGSRTAAIHIASNDADENPFDINLTGTATVPTLVPGELVAPHIAISGGNIILTVHPSVVGRSYQLQASETMTAGTWQDLGAIRVGDGNILVFTVQYIPSVRQRFYRLVLVGVSTAPEGFLLIPDGPFQMGDQSNPTLGESDELPVHTVNVSAFYMAKTEVTKEEWDAVRTWGLANGYMDLPAGNGSYDLKGVNHPVHSINWYDIVKWCNARSQKEGLTPCYTVGGTTYKTGSNAPDCNWRANGYRLPTEAEWEKAARGGAAGRNFPWGDTISHNQANYYSSSSFAFDVSSTRGYHSTFALGEDPYSSPVGSFAPNGYGLYDMAGNMWEWCWDWYAGYPAGSVTDPQGPPSGASRVFRGGSWESSAFGCRGADRAFFTPDSVDYGVGFRLARGQP